MKRLQNTLYAMSEGMYLHHEGEAVVAERDHHVVMRLPIHTISGIVAVAGNVTVSPHLQNLCCERGVAVSYLDRNGKFLARVEGPVSGNVKLRLSQVRAYEDVNRKGSIARSFVIGKVMNCRNVLLRRLRDHGADAAVESAAERLKGALAALRDAKPDVATIRGIEGEAALEYFKVFDGVIKRLADAAHCGIEPLTVAAGGYERHTCHFFHVVSPFLYIFTLHYYSNAAKKSIV